MGYDPFAESFAVQELTERAMSERIEPNIVSVMPPLYAACYALIPSGPKWEIYGPKPVFRVDIFGDIAGRANARWWLRDHDSPIHREDLFLTKKEAEAELVQRLLRTTICV